MRMRLGLTGVRPSQDTGVTSIEYALLASLIAMVIILAVTSLGVSVNGLFSAVADAFNGISTP